MVLYKFMNSVCLHVYRKEHLLEKGRVVHLKFYFFLVLGMLEGSEAMLSKRGLRSL